MKLVHCMGGMLLACMLCSGPALAAEGDFILKGGQAYRVDGGKKTPLKNCEPQEAQTETGTWSWIRVDSGESEEMKGSENGVYFFHGKEGKPAGFIPIKEEASSCRIYFSPSGEKLLLSWGMEYIQHLSLYVIDKNKGFINKASFDIAGPPIWIDHHRFIFNSVNTSKGLRAEGKFDSWWTSVVLYDSAIDERIVIKEATATKDYSINDYNDSDGSIIILESSVKNKNDWKDDDKVKDVEIKVPAPAAG